MNTRLKEMVMRSMKSFDGAARIKRSQNAVLERPLNLFCVTKLGNFT